MRSRAIIEQAKGMIMERYGCTPDEAFDRLARLSQHANVKLADVASALVESVVTSEVAGRPAVQPGGSRQPSPASVARAHRIGLEQRQWPKEGSPDSEFGTRLRATARRTRLRAELLASRTGQELLDAVVTVGLADRKPMAAVLANIAVGGVVEVIGTYGVPPAIAHRWRSVPIDLDLRACAVARTGQAAWLTSAGPRNRRRVPQLGFGLPDGWTSAALLPLNTGLTCVGLLAVTWKATPEHRVDDGVATGDERAELVRLASAVAVAVQRLSHVPARSAPAPVDQSVVDQSVVDQSVVGQASAGQAPTPRSERAGAHPGHVHGGQGSPGQGSPPGHGSPGHGSTSQGSPGHGSTSQGSTSQGSADQGMIGQNSVGQAGLAGLALDETGTAVLDMVLEPVLVCEPVLVDDRVVDLRIGYVNPAAAVSGRVSGSGVSGSGGGHAGRGRSFLELYPESAGNGLFEACLDVLTTGTQVDLTGLGLATPAGETGRGSGSGRSDELGTGRELFDVRIARHRRGVLIAWMPTADQVSRIDPGAGNP